jgi:LCP family protein required for cell wall assembly
LFTVQASAVTAVKQAVEGTLGLPVHYVVVIDLDGFSDLVDALGGVTIRIIEPIPIGSGGELLEPGLRRLDGYEALWYARSRTDLRGRRVGCSPSWVPLRRATGRRSR